MGNNKIYSRRSFLKYSLGVAASIALANPLESVAAFKVHPMSFYHTHTGERFMMTYSCDGCPIETLEKLNDFLCDFRTGEVHPIDPRLLDILFGIQQNSGSRGIIEVISGYRSPKTNNFLRSQSDSVARKSLHMKGQALDIRITDLKIAQLRDAAVSLRRGGVGYYSKSNFVHIDTGRFRTW
jgi:uncharacterized protein YcbK (DUF882 family)